MSIPSKAKDADKFTVKGSQFVKPYFEFSGACAGCGETPYMKLLHPAVRRSDDHCQRHRLLLHLGCIRTVHALHHRRKRQRPGLG